jgi:hypothetical protein
MFIPLLICRSHLLDLVAELDCEHSLCQTQKFRIHQRNINPRPVAGEISCGPLEEHQDSSRHEALFIATISTMCMQILAAPDIRIGNVAQCIVKQGKN